MPPIRLFLDEDVHKFMASALRQRGWEALSVVEAGRRSINDPEQLAFAADEGYSIVTFNAHDFARLHSQYAEQGREHFGIIVGVKLDPQRTLRGLLTLLDSLSADDLKNLLIYASNWSR